MNDLGCELPFWAVLLMALGSFGPIAVPALMVCLVGCVWRWVHGRRVRHAAARRAVLRAEARRSLRCGTSDNGEGAL